ncbi:MAG TPA: sialidase family protein [Mycobacteriales bacterium]|nr:sialidase family protein [Mycobacteriales bacterium]
MLPRRIAIAVAVAGLSTGALAANAVGSSGPSEATFGAPAGGFAAYHGTAMKTDAKKAPSNAKVAYSGRKLVLAQSYIGRNAAEPTLGVGLTGAIYTVAADFDALPSQSPKNEPRTLVEKSTDGGRTWHVTQPSIAGQNSMVVSTDPYIYVDPHVTQRDSRVFDIDLQGVNGAHLAFSDDGGKTWTQSLLSSAGANDHQTLVTGVEPKGVSIPLTDSSFKRVVYYCVNQVADGSCVRSFDGGRTFIQGNQTGYMAVNPQYLSTFDEQHNEGVCGSLHGHAVTDNAGRLFIPRGYCDIPMIAISDDAATTFHTVRVSKVSMYGEQASVATDRNGTLYYVWQGGGFNLPYLSISRDHGEHWSTPLMIAPPGVHEVDFPSIDVGDPGRVAITFPGTTSSGGTKDKTRPWNSYEVVSTNALSKNPLFLSNIANPKWDPVHRGDCGGASGGRCGHMYDFLDIVSSPIDQGRVFATAVDTCTALLKCNSKRVAGENDDNIFEYELGETHGAALDMKGVVIREVTGPALRGPARWITRDSHK